MRWREIPLEKLLRYGILAAMSAAFVYAKLRYNPALDRACYDGCYYFQIARNVAEGNGFSTNLSLYSIGLKSFPHHIVQAPLWPLTMALFAQAIPLRVVAMMLPEALYLASLLLLHLLVGRMMERLGGQYEARYLTRRFTWLHVADIVTLAFATNTVFFHHTSTPHTEAEAFFLLFATLLMVDVAATRRSPLWAAAAGGLGALTVMTRHQYIGVLIAVPLALLASSVRAGKGWKLATATLTGSVVVFIPWALYLDSWMEAGPGLGHVLGLSPIARQTPELPKYAFRIPDPDVWNYVVTRLQAFYISLNPFSAYSYYQSHRWAVFVIPVAALHFFLKREEWPKAMRFVSGTAGAVVTATALTGVLAVGPLHHIHHTAYREWLFGWRHGLPLVLLTAVAIAYLMVRGRRHFRLLVVVLLGLSVLHNLVEVEERSGPTAPIESSSRPRN